jgi:hypothetical protein
LRAASIGKQVEPASLKIEAQVTFGHFRRCLALTLEERGRDTPASLQMKQSATIERPALAEATSGNASSSPGGFSTLIQAASLEFLASVQLLVERARFITGASGVALAVKHAEQFVYCASCGNPAQELHSSADLRNKMLQQCVEKRQTTRSDSAAEGNFSVAVPILRSDEVFGFFEVTAGREFRDSDIDAISRLAEMVNTALEHRDAAEEVEGLLKQADVEPAVPPVAASLVSAPDVAARPEEPVAPARSPALAIHGCKSCGFPVSSKREICLDCEEKLPGAGVVSSKELFSTPATESWFGAHGYTIASLLVTAVAAAIIYWLR